MNTICTKRASVLFYRFGVKMSVFCLRFVLPQYVFQDYVPIIIISLIELYRCFIVTIKLNIEVDQPSAIFRTIRSWIFEPLNIEAIRLLTILVIKFEHVHFTTVMYLKAVGLVVNSVAFCGVWSGSTLFTTLDIHCLLRPRGFNA